MLSFVVCPSLSNFFGCGLIFAVGVIYGLMGFGRKYVSTESTDSLSVLYFIVLIIDQLIICNLLW